ncbi:class I SAM-dependent methyltransferase [Roseibium sp. MMSF_3544]|uniref:class I SAM-dependent methyltransferase n=1 Tax=unclassified Roseibium TaxID=2629323 RepID=UPI00273FE5DA|nr:methyltransferase domain-containing protein [Roseibium sp. MMSF_3544]
MEEPVRNFDLKEQIRAYWSARAESFDDSPSHRIEDNYGAPEWRAFLRQAIGLENDQSASGIKVLDLACGTGEISRMLCDLEADVIGLDFSEEMLSRARVKLAGKSWSPLLSDAENLEAIEDGSIDFAVTRHLAWTLTNPAKAFAEWFRILSPSGRLLINDGNWMRPLSRHFRMKLWLAHLLDPVPPRDADDATTDTAIRARLPYRGGLTEERLVIDLANAGFRKVATLDPRPLYNQGMRAHTLANRLRQSSENRFAVVFVKD